MTFNFPVRSVYVPFHVVPGWRLSLASFPPTAARDVCGARLCVDNFTNVARIIRDFITDVHNIDDNQNRTAGDDAAGCPFVVMYI